MPYGCYWSAGEGVRNLPEETHRAPELRAAEHGRSTEAEIRAILEEAVRPEKRVKIASAGIIANLSKW